MVPWDLELLQAGFRMLNVRALASKDARTRMPPYEGKRSLSLPGVLRNILDKEGRVRERPPPEAE